MSDTDQTRSEIIVMHRMPSHQALMKSNRWLLRCVLLLMAVIFIGGFLLVPKGDYEAIKQKNFAYAENNNPRLMAEMDSLKGQMVGLVSGSIEGKLRSLEASIKAGSVNGSLGTIEDIKNDLKVLRGYNHGGKAETAVKVDNERLIEEMSHLKRLIYFTLASCGLMFAAVAGVWIRHRQLPFKATIMRHLKNL